MIKRREWKANTHQKKIRESQIKQTEPRKPPWKIHKQAIPAVERTLVLSTSGGAGRMQDEIILEVPE